MASKKVDVGAQLPVQPRSTESKPWRVHVTLGAGLALCAAAFYFELHRALGGNALSWAYVFEWPLLGIFLVYMWWKVLHPVNEEKAASAQPMIAPEFEGMLAAWEDHLRQVQQPSEAPAKRELS